MSNTPKLNPCPFCGGEARLQMGDGISYSRAGCTKCWATAVGKPTDKQAMKAWNVRDNEKGLKDFLLIREDDIALGIENFEDLKDIFIEIFERKPKND